MKTALEELKARSDRLDPEGRDLLGKLESEGEADAAFGRARERYFAGDLDRTEAELDAADATSCPERKTRIAQNRVKIERLRRLEASAETAISGCRLADIEAMSDHLSGVKLVFLTRVRAKLEQARGPISSARANVDGSEPLYRQGDLGAAERRLTKAESQLGKLPEGRACEAMRTEIRDRLTEINSLRRDLARADAAISSCDLPAIERLSARFEGRDHVLIEAKRRELRGAAERCAEQEEEEAVATATARCRARLGTGSEAYKDPASGSFRCKCADGYLKQDGGKSCVSVAESERAGQRYCADNYRGGILREVKADGSYSCACEKGKYADNERKACLTWDEVVANARAACEAEGTILATVKGPGKHRCCPAGTHTYDQASKRCWTWDAMVADAQAQCRQKGQVAAWVNGVNDYLCCPAGSNRFDRKTNTCHNDAAAAQQMIQGLGTIMQGLGAASRARNRDRRSRRNRCANPPPGCHCRPGTTQLHCGKESGGSRKTVAPRPSGPSLTGCRWVRATIAGFGKRSGWACRCNEGTISYLAPKYCGPKPN
ncbi:MAG: hypothetical protein QF893_05235 [Alphaproteobacteria bacterium]|nr:hypothetical protein [Alphaproteobacteria bacterium]